MLSSILRFSFGYPMVILCFSLVRSSENQDMFFDTVSCTFSSKVKFFRYETRLAEHCRLVGIPPTFDFA